MTPIAERLAAHPFLSGLAPEKARGLARLARTVRFAAGRYLLREGRPAQTFYLVEDGLVRLELHAPGRGALTLQSVGRGEALGWSWLLPPYRWAFDAAAVEPVACLALDGAKLRRAMERDPTLGFFLARRLSGVLASRLAASRHQLLDLYAPPR